MLTYPAPLLVEFLQHGALTQVWPQEVPGMTLQPSACCQACCKGDAGTSGAAAVPLMTQGRHLRGRLCHRRPGCSLTWDCSDTCKQGWQGLLLLPIRYW